LGECYGLLTDTSLGELTLSRALSSRPDPDADTPQAPNGARAHLVADVLSESSTRAVAAAGRERVAAFCRGQDPTAIVSEVETVAPRLEQLDTEDITSFLGRAVPRPAGPQMLSAEPWSETALLNEENKVSRCYLWAPAALSFTNAWSGIERHPVPDEELPNGGLSLKVVRLDCAAPCSVDRLSIFSREARVRAELESDEDLD
jgi:hypothetical protein